LLILVNLLEAAKVSKESLTFLFQLLFENQYFENKVSYFCIGKMPYHNYQFLQ